MNDPHADKQVRVPTVSRVCSDTLVELVYDHEARRTALAVSRFGGLWNIEREVRIETGELLVPYAASNNLIANRCVLLPSKPVEYGSKQELLADIKAYLHRYVDLTPLFEEIAAHYVLLTWVHDAFNELPYLRLQGEYGTGKTRGLLTIGSICYRPFFGSGASSTSAIFRTMDAFGGTLILDEADLPYSDARADLVKIFNNGTVRGMPVLRTEVNRNKEFNPTAYNVFGPKLIAMREEFQDQALESRFLTEEMGNRPLRADIPIQLPRTLAEEALTLRNRLLHYRLCEFFNIKSNDVALVQGIEPRLNQTAISLLSLIDDKHTRTNVQEALVVQNDDLLSLRRDSEEGRVIAAVAASIAAAPGTPAGVSDISRRYNAGNSDGEIRSARWIGNILRKRLRIKTRREKGVYIVPVSENARIQKLSHRFGFSLDSGL